MYGGEVRIGKDLVGFLSDRCNRLARLADEPWAKRTLEFLRPQGTTGDADFASRQSATWLDGVDLGSAVQVW